MECADAVDSSCVSLARSSSSVKVAVGTVSAAIAGGIIRGMSPTVFREGGFRFYFFSREEPRMHVHVHGQNGEAKFWLEPAVELAQNSGLSPREIHDACRLIQEHEDEIRAAWTRHFSG